MWVVCGLFDEHLHAALKYHAVDVPEFRLDFRLSVVNVLKISSADFCVSFSSSKVTSRERNEIAIEELSHPPESQKK